MNSPKVETFITFAEGSPNPSTKTWDVFAKQGNLRLGEVRWFGRWRCYSFMPVPDTVFEQ